MKGIRTIVFATLALLVILPSMSQAGEIMIRLSFKYILDGDGNRPGTADNAYYTNENNLINAIANANTALRRWNRGYQFEVMEIVEVSDAVDFFDIADGNEGRLLEQAAEADPVKFFWRQNAVNFYIVGTAPAAFCSIPSTDSGYEHCVMVPDVNNTPADPNARETILVHELGHHFDLIHVFADDLVEDTRLDADPFQCLSPFSCALGGTGECCCSTKITNLDNEALAENWTAQERDDIRFNIMSYYGATDCVTLGETSLSFNNIRLTEGQLDRWTDATRTYHSGECSGLTHFVDWQNTTGLYSGYSYEPFQTVAGGVGASNPGGGDILLIRTGVYNESGIFDAKVTLWPNRGPVIIGTP